MDRLEARDAGDRQDGTPRSERLRAVRPEVGRFLHALVLATGARCILECGTSGGYSTLWLASAARASDGCVVTFETDDTKVALAADGFREAGLDDTIEIRPMDAREGLKSFVGDADLVFIDIEKEQYEELLGTAVRALRPGGTLVADNLLSHERELREFRDEAIAHPELFAVVVPIGRGELLAVKVKPTESGVGS